MDQTKASTETLKFLCSYGGKILPRHGDGQLRYVGGLNRVLAVDRSVSFAELMVKLGQFCGFSVNLKCQLPDGDLETLVSIKSDEDFANLIEEYDRASATRRHLKIRAILSPRKPPKEISPSSSVEDFAASFKSSSPAAAVKSVPSFFASRGSSPVRFAGGIQRGGYGRVSYYPCHVEEGRFLHHHDHHHNHHGRRRYHHEVPRCYYWQ
ncbi:PB1 domain containing protein [Trema orientale]|uniref:PB1 domain containing protein n=1 Tax=Trema orientale TaxID=63057 RepID=A0A2P5FG30_TREOI|nr:PB1 domain containing protein [Trema orientale]